VGFELRGFLEKVCSLRAGRLRRRYQGRLGGKENGGEEKSCVTGELDWGEIRRR